MQTQIYLVGYFPLVRECKQVMKLFATKLRSDYSSIKMEYDPYDMNATQKNSNDAFPLFCFAARIHPAAYKLGDSYIFGTNASIDFEGDLENAKKIHQLAKESFFIERSRLESIIDNLFNKPQISLSVSKIDYKE